MKDQHSKKRPLTDAIRDLHRNRSSDPELNAAANAMIREFNIWHATTPAVPEPGSPKHIAGWELCNEVESLNDVIRGGMSAAEIDERMSTDHEGYNTGSTQKEVIKMSDETRKTAAAKLGSITGRTIVVGSIIASKTGSGIAAGSKATHKFMKETGIPAVRTAGRKIKKDGRSFFSELRNEIKDYRNNK